MNARVQRALSSRRWVLALVALALGLSAPSIASGFATEDWLFRFSATRPFELGNLNLYDARDLALGVDAARRFGSLPWITPDDFHISFWRPLASLGYHLDYRVWGHSPALAHLHSVLVYLGLVAAAAALFRKLLRPAWVAGLAALLFTVDDAHAHAVGWIANRHVILGALFGCLALFFHHRWRAEGSRAAAALAPVMLALGFASSEATVGAFGYFLAYAAFLDDGRRRLLSLAPAFLVTAAWAVGFKLFGHGAVGSALYIDPVRDPFGYLRELPNRLGALLAGQLGPIRADRWHELSSGGRWLLAFGGFALFFILVGPPRQQRAARFFAVGLLLSLLPACATFPSDRSLFLPGIGAFGLIALWVERARRERLASKIVAALLLVLHVSAAPALFPYRSLAMARMDAAVRRASDSAYASVTGLGERLVVVNSPDFYFCKLLEDLRWSRGLPAVPMTCLAGTLGPMTVERIDPNALSLTVPASFLDRPFDRLYRDRHHPMQVGDKVFVGTALVEITQVDERGAPTQAVFRFMWPIGSKVLRFVVFDGGRYVPFTPPDVGQELTLGG